VKKEEAIALRREGYSYAMITSRIGISKSTLSNWLKDVPYKANSLVLERINTSKYASGERMSQQRINSTTEIKRAAKEEVGTLSKRDLFMLGIGLYIGEGSKSIESVRMVNSDPKVIALSMRWFREVCSLEDSNFSLAMHIYPDTNETEAKVFWGNVTELGLDRFKKTQIDIRTGKSVVNRDKLRYGTLQIRIKANNNPDNGVNLFRKIAGWSEAVMSKRV
jgi:lambda repressor-like predicted transcriptional regulator